MHLCFLNNIWDKAITKHWETAVSLSFSSLFWALWWALGWAPTWKTKFVLVRILLIIIITDFSGFQDIMNKIPHAAQHALAAIPEAHSKLRENIILNIRWMLTACEPHWKLIHQLRLGKYFILSAHTALQLVPARQEKNAGKFFIFVKWITKRYYVCVYCWPLTAKILRTSVIELTDVCVCYWN